MFKRTDDGSRGTGALNTRTSATTRQDGLMAFGFGLLKKFAATAGAAVIAIAIFNVSQDQDFSIWKTQRTLPPVPKLERGGKNKQLVDAASIRQRIIKEPIDARSYVNGALLAASVDGDRSAEPIMKHALRIDPRNTAARSWLFNLSLRQERFAEAVNEASVLYQLDPLVDSPLSYTLAILTQLGDVRAIIIKRFYMTPFLSAILRAVPANGLDEQALLEIAAAVAPSAQGDAQSKILSEALERGDYAAASRALKSFRASAGTSQDLIHDGFFKGLKGPPPFTWSLVANDDVRAEAINLPGLPSALQLDRFSSSSAVAARQSVLVEAGSYRFSYLVKAGRQGSRAIFVAPFTWAITCPSIAKPDLASMPISVVGGSNWTSVSLTIEVPSTCKLIDIALSSTQAEANMVTDVTITRVRLVRVQ